MMNAILDQTAESLQTRRRIYLHCWGGIGRTGTTVGCYLVRQGKTADEALDQLSAWWRSVPKSQYHPHSPETREQVKFIRTWAEHDNKLRTPYT
jgi:protein-tyrosine phosphatase